MAAGKPVRQAVAIGYAEQQRSGNKHTRLDRGKVSKWTQGHRKEYE